LGLVGSAQLGPNSNHRRGRANYGRSKESIAEAFAYLEKLEQERILSVDVMKVMKRLAAAGEFDGVIAEARGRSMTPGERRFLRRLER
jgi:hypothetical protein